MFGAYIHIPFCRHKCSYCDFYSITSREYIPEYIDSIIGEMRLFDELTPRRNKKLTSIYIGGGTPSLLKPNLIAKLLEELDKHYRLPIDCEITLEANPATAGLKEFKEFRAAGINRLSIGFQSLNDEELTLLQRIHNSTDALNAYGNARKAGFDNISVDLIFGIPGQTYKSWFKSLYSVVKLGVDHISAYSLSYEEYTPMYNALLKGEIARCDEAIEADFYEICIDYLTSCGFKHYEVSSYAREGKKCEHNRNYWLGGEYLGFGAAASGFVDGKRFSNKADVKNYIADIAAGVLPVDEMETLNKQTLITERIFLELRSEGIRIKNYKKEFGVDLKPLFEQIAENWRHGGFVNISKDRISLTSKGFLFCDYITVQIITQIEKFFLKKA